MEPGESNARVDLGSAAHQSAPLRVQDPDCFRAVGGPACFWRHAPASRCDLRIGFAHKRVTSARETANRRERFGNRRYAAVSTVSPARCVDQSGPREARISLADPVRRNVIAPFAVVVALGATGCGGQSGETTVTVTAPSVARATVHRNASHAAEPKGRPCPAGEFAPYGPRGGCYNDPSPNYRNEPRVVPERGAAVRRRLLVQRRAGAS